jgi:hypothetical protein
MLSSLLNNTISFDKYRFPNFITGNKVIASNTEIDKIFPKIGLPNSIEPISVKFDTSSVQLDKVIHLAIKKFIQEWQDNNPSNRLKGLELFKISRAVYLLEELNRKFNKKIGFEYSKDRVVLTESIPSYDGKVLVKSGTDIFKLVKNLLTCTQKYVKVDLVSADEMSAQCKKLQIAFSSADVDGAWDIATMSMRGVKSCMRWEARQCSSLVGSIIDPCCGIIYLTNGTVTEYGSKMLFRSVVRLALHYETGKPILLVDRLYSSFYKTKPGEQGRFDQQVKNIFIEYLQKKVPLCQVVDAQTRAITLAKYELPRPPNFNFLVPEEVSYRDTPIQYSQFLNYDADKIVKQLKKSGKKKSVKIKSKSLSKQSYKL